MRGGLWAVIRKICLRVMAITLFGVWTGLVGASSLAEAADADGSVLQIGVRQFPSSLHPLFSSEVSQSFILGAVNRPITAWDSDWNLICLLCEEIPSFANGGAKIIPGADGKDHVEMTWRLKSGLAWGDGKPVTVDDVIFTWQVARHEETGAVGYEFFRRILRMEKLDDRGWVVEIDRVSYDYQTYAGFTLLAKHVEEKAFASPGEYRKRSLWVTGPSEPGLHNGPYQIDTVRQGSRITLVRNKHWSGPSPIYQRIIISVTENSSSLEARLLSGDVDLIPGEVGLPADVAMIFQRRHGKEYRVVWRQGLQYEHIDMRLDHPILSDIRVRTAILAGVDREAMVKELFQKHFTVAHGPLAPRDVMYPSATEINALAVAFDRKRATALLDAAGWQVGRDGIRQRDGKKLRLEMVTTSDSRTRQLTAQYIQSQLLAIGIELKLKFEPPRILFGDTVGKRKFRAMAMYAWVSAPDSSPRSTLHSDQIPDPENRRTGQNYPGLADEKMDAILDQVESALQPDARKRIWLALLHRYTETLPAIPLYYYPIAHVMRGAGITLPLTGHSSPSTLWVENWR